MSRNSERGIVWLSRIFILVAFLTGWEFLPSIAALRSAIPLFDPFVISSPTRIARELWALASGHGAPSVWPYLLKTLESTVVGTAIGIAAGAIIGLILCNSQLLAEIWEPFITLLNATPRIALIPIMVIIFGPNGVATAAGAVLLVSFITFYNAFEGGRAIAPEVLQNARILGCSKWGVMFRIRGPYVMAWTFATVPNAVSFGLVGVVTGEVLSGVAGMGSLLTTAINSVEATLTFGVVVYLAFFGLLLVSIVSLLRRRLLHWWTVS